ncbi:MAG: glycerol kinase, partial [Gammaproteobacteria bacterium]|nr:glycerol kinase [Gammaproteobacteria bacterium]
MNPPATACLALDQGTLSSRALLYDETGTVLCSASRRITLKRIDAQHVEQDGVEILASILAVLDEVLAAQQATRVNIKSAGLATQRSSILAWQPSSGKVLSPVLSWQDTRAADWLSGFESQAELIQAKTGLRLSPHYSVSKMQWLLQHNRNVQQALAQQDCVITPLASYLLYHLTDQQHIQIDIANACRSLLCNLQQRDWDAQLLQLFSMPPALLPECRPISYNYGTIKQTGIPITAVNGDQTAA